jgi:hypothetical protein
MTAWVDDYERIREINHLRNYEWRELEQWARSEYPDMSEEFDNLPKTLIDFIEARYPYLIQEYSEASGHGHPNIVYCT